MNQHTLTDIIRDTLGKYKIGREGNVLVLVPDVPTEDMILICKEGGIVLSMYKKPETKEDWKITDTHSPLLITTKQLFCEVPQEVKLEGDNILATYEDGTTIEAGINRELSPSIIDEATKSIKAIPDKMDGMVEATPFTTHASTDSISVHDGIVVAGNNKVVVRYNSEKTTKNIRVRNKYVLELIKTVSKQAGEESVGIVAGSRNIVVSTNPGDTTKQSDNAHVYAICSSHGDDTKRTPQEVVENTTKVIDDPANSVIMKSEDGISGVLQVMHSILTKYTGGTSVHMAMEIDKDEMRLSIKDSKVKVEHVIDTKSDKITRDKGTKLPVAMLIRTSVVRFLLNMGDNIKEIKLQPSGRKRLFVVTTDSETAVFAA